MLDGSWIMAARRQKRKSYEFSRAYHFPMPLTPQPEPIGASSVWLGQSARPTLSAVPPFPLILIACNPGTHQRKQDTQFVLWASLLKHPWPPLYSSPAAPSLINTTWTQCSFSKPLAYLRFPWPTSDSLAADPSHIKTRRIHNCFPRHLSPAPLILSTCSPITR